MRVYNNPIIHKLPSPPFKTNSLLWQEFPPATALLPPGCIAPEQCLGSNLHYTDNFCHE